MSLINDALKKAQIDVERGRMSPVPGMLTGMHPQKKRSGSFLFILATLLVVGSAGWAVALFVSIPSKKADTPVVAQAAAPTALSQAPMNELVTPAPVEPIEVATEVPIVEAEPVVEPTVSAEAIILGEPAPLTAWEPPAVAEVVVPETKPVVEPISATPSGRDTAALKDEIAFKLKHLEITAVMGDGKNARIMTGGQVFNTDELINLELKIRFMGKKGSTLYFTDQHNLLYEKAL